MTTVTIDATNVAVVQGRLSGAPRRRELPSGSVLVELDVTTRGDGGSSSVPVAWFEPGGARRLAAGGRRVARRRLCATAILPDRGRPRRAAPRSSPSESCGVEASPGRAGPRRGGRGDRRRAVKARQPHRVAGLSARRSPGTGRCLLRHLDSGHLGGGRTDPAPGDGLGHVLLRALEHRLHRSVGAVAHPAGEPQIDGLAPARLAEPHALHEPTDDDAVADAVGHLRQADRSVRRCQSAQAQRQGDLAGLDRSRCRWCRCPSRAGTSLRGPPTSPRRPRR